MATKEVTVAVYRKHGIIELMKANLTYDPAKGCSVFCPATLRWPDCIGRYIGSTRYGRPKYVEVTEAEYKRIKAKEKRDTNSNNFTDPNGAA